MKKYLSDGMLRIEPSRDNVFFDKLYFHGSLESTKTDNLSSMNIMCLLDKLLELFRLFFLNY